MTTPEKQIIINWLNAPNEQFKARGRILEWLETVEITDAVKDQRTPKQNRGLWLYITQRIQALNEAGLDQRTVLKPSIAIPWSKEAFHDLVWIPIQKAMFGTESTKDLTTKQLDPIHEVIERELREKHGVEHISFPSEESKMMSTREDPDFASYYEGDPEVVGL